MSIENGQTAIDVVGRHLRTDPRKGLEREIEALLDAKDTRIADLKAELAKNNAEAYGIQETKLITELKAENAKLREEVDVYKSATAHWEAIRQDSIQKTEALREASESLDKIRETALTGHAHPDMTAIEVIAYYAHKEAQAAISGREGA